jgi:hypothetical protein
MTAHWINGDFNMHNKTLGCSGCMRAIRFTNSLRDECLLNLFTRYKFDKLNIIAVVSDTTGNMNKFGMKLEEQNITHIYCTNHVIQLTAKKAYLDKFYNIVHGAGNDDDEDLPPNSLEAEISTMAKARTLVEFFLRSNQSTEGECRTNSLCQQKHWLVQGRAWTYCLVQAVIVMIVNSE